MINNSNPFGKDKNKDKNKNKQKNRLIKRFSLIVFASVFLYSVFAAVGVVIYGVTRDDTKQSIKDNQPTVSNQEEDDNVEIEEPKLITNVAVFGTDGDGLRTDVIFIVSFNSETKEINLVSVPRDTKVKMTEEIINGLVSRNREGFIPYLNGEKGVCKINEIHAYAGEGYRTEYSVLMLEDLLGINIDYSVKFTTSTFRYVVDAIGGVEFDVPMDLHYDDPVQGLYIHLNAGVQVLNGDKAEQLVRYREGYASKDLQRIKVQQDFMKAFIKKILDSDTLVNNIPSLAKTVLSYVETDATIMDVLKYVKYIDDISMDKVTMETIPGEGGSYFNHDKEETEKLVERIFYKTNDDIKNDENEPSIN